MIRKINALFVATIASVALVIGNPTPASATCGQAELYVYENMNLGGDVRLICYATNWSHLGNMPHLQAGLCESANVRIGDHWDDCINSALFDEGSVNTSVCLWEDPNYGGTRITKFNSDAWANYNFFSWGDSISSIKWGSTC